MHERFLRQVTMEVTSLEDAANLKSNLNNAHDSMGSSYNVVRTVLEEASVFVEQEETKRKQVVIRRLNQLGLLSTKNVLDLIRPFINEENRKHFSGE